MVKEYDEAREREIFASNLQYWLTITGFSKTQLAEELEVSQAAVTHWCNGTKMPRMGKVQAIADLFGINKSDLLNDIDKIDFKRNELFDKKKVLFRTIEKVTEEDLDKINSIIEMIIGDKYDD